jgi:hypothetical protein
MNEDDVLSTACNAMRQAACQTALAVAVSGGDFEKAILWYRGLSYDLDGPYHRLVQDAIVAGLREAQESDALARSR